MKGRTLRRMRREAGLTQAALAGKLAVAKNTVWRWEADAAPIPERTARLIRLLAGDGVDRA